MALAKRSILVVVLVLFILVVVWPRSLSTPRIFLNQRRAVLSIEDVSLAERNYAARHPETGYVCSPLKVSDLERRRPREPLRFRTAAVFETVAKTWAWGVPARLPSRKRSAIVRQNSAISLDSHNV